MRTAFAFLTLAVLPLTACDPETAPRPEAETRPAAMPGTFPGLDPELPPATARDEDTTPRCRFRAEWPNIAWVHVNPGIPENPGGHPPGSVYFAAIERSPAWEEENEDYPHVLRADCENLAITGSTAWIELESAAEDDEWFEYVRVHPSNQTPNAWFFTYWGTLPPDPPVRVFAHLFVGNRHVGGSVRDHQHTVYFGVTQDEDDNEGSFFCPSCTEDETTGELSCSYLAGWCPIP